MQYSTNVRKLSLVKFARAICVGCENPQEIVLFYMKNSKTHFAEEKSNKIKSICQIACNMSTHGIKFLLVQPSWMRKF